MGSISVDTDQFWLVTFLYRIYGYRKHLYIIPKYTTYAIIIILMSTDEC